MKRILLAGVALGALSAFGVGPALAVPPAPFTWTGWYGGVNGGFDWSDWCYSIAPKGTFRNPLVVEPEFTRLLRGNLGSGTGFSGGVQSGFNQQIGMFVVGLHSDMDWGGVDKRKSSVLNVPSVFGFAPGTTYNTVLSHRIEDYSTLRVRAGVTWGQFLVYGTGGVAWGQERSRASAFLTPTPGFSFNYTGVDKIDKAGSVFGGGVEFAVTNYLTVFGEYLSINFGSHRFFANPNTFGTSPSFPAGGFFATRSDTSMSVFRVGMNYKFDSGGPLETWFPVLNTQPTGYDWKGWYGGPIAGGAWNNSHRAFFPGGTFNNPSFVDPAVTGALFRNSDGRGGGALGGWEIGYDHQYGPVILGWEIFADYSSLNDRRVQPSAFTNPAFFDVASRTFTTSFDQRIQSYGGVISHFGVACDRWQAYGSVGTVLGNVRTRGFATVDPALTTTFGGVTTTTPFSYAGRSSDLRAGTALGGGVKYAWTDSIHLNAEFLHVNFSDHAVSLQPTDPLGRTFPAGGFFRARERAEFDLFKFGVNFRY